MIRAQARYPRTTDAIVRYARGDVHYDVPALTDWIAEAGARGKTLKVIGTAMMGWDVDEPQPPVWFDWTTGDPTYGCVPLVSNLTMDLTEATFKGHLPRPPNGGWMSSTTRNAWFYTPTSSVDNGVYSDIHIIGGTFDYGLTIPDAEGIQRIPANTYAFGFFSTDRFSLNGTKFIGEVFEKRYRGFFMRNCRWPTLLDIDCSWLSQLFWCAFTDYGYMRGTRLYEFSEGMDFDEPARGWLIKDTTAACLPEDDPLASGNEQLFDLSSVSETIIDGVIMENCAAVVQAYTKPSSWQSYAEQKRNSGTFAVTFDLSANTMTFTGDISQPDVDDGAHIEVASGTPPTGLTTLKIYHLVNVSGATCQLSLTEGGAAIDLSGSFSNVTMRFRPRNIRIVDRLTVRNVKAINMRRNEYAAFCGLIYSSTRYWSAGQLQCGTVTFQDWELDNGNSIVVNEGRDVRLLNIKTTNARPVGNTLDANTDYAFVLRQYKGGTAETLERQANVVMRGCSVYGSTGGGVRCDSVTNLEIVDLTVDGFTGSTWTVGLDTFDTRKGLIVGRGGLKPGVTFLDNINIARGTVAGCTNFYFDDASATEEYVLSFPRVLNLVGLSGVAYTPMVVIIQTAESRRAIRNKRQIYFDSTFDTAASATLEKLIHNRSGVEAQVIACSIVNPTAPTGTNSNNSKVTLVNSTAGTPADIANGSIVIDYSASGIAADSVRNMGLLGSADANSLIAAGSTLKAVVAAGTGSSVAPAFMLNVALIEYTSA
ncbi:MAG TPA: hypothetical protein VGE09_08585 [Pseudoxanthomonas sp.]